MLRSREHPDDTRQKLWQALNYRLLLYCRQTPKKRYEFDSHKNSDYPHSKVIAAHSSHSDATYLIPAGVWIHLVFYNRLHYERLGLKVPQTWSDFLDNCRQLKSAGITPLASDGYSYAIQWPEIMLARAVGEDTLRRTIKSTGSDFTKDPRYRAVFQAIRDLHQPGWYLDGWQGSRWPAAQRRWIQGEATHMINGSWLLRETNEYKPDPKVIQIGAFPVPLLDTVQNELEISAYAEIPGYSLIKGSGNRQGARMLLRFLMRRNSGSTLAKMGKEISSVVDAEFPDGLNEVKEHLTNSTALLTAGMRSYAPRWYKFVFHENYYPFFLHENPLEEKFLTVEIFLQRLAKDTINQQRHVAVERQP
jgi:raffinose/stachyose/melibiose transport system substrate-binding protein